MGVFRPVVAVNLKTPPAPLAKGAHDGLNTEPHQHQGDEKFQKGRDAVRHGASEEHQ
jgi:hypothetical protein